MTTKEIPTAWKNVKTMNGSEKWPLIGKFTLLGESWYFASNDKETHTRKSLIVLSSLTQIPLTKLKTIK